MRSLSLSAASLLIALMAFVLFVPGLGSVHLFDWDEINFAEIAREMLATSDWSRPTIDYQPFYEKPPLFPWMQALCMQLFGVNEFAARLPNAICGIVTLLCLFRMGSRERSPLFGWLWVFAYIGSILPHMYFRSGIIDPWFNLFIFLGLTQLLRAMDDDSMWRAMGAGALLGLAILSKGPVAIIVVGIAVLAWTVWRRSMSVLRWDVILPLALGALVVTSSYFLIDYIRHGPDFIKAFYQRQYELFFNEDAGHGGFFGYHFVVLLIGCFPASLFAIAEMWKGRRSNEGSNSMRSWMLVLFWTVLILFSIVNTKILHYSSLCYFPLTYLAARYMERLWNNEVKAAWALRIPLGVIGNVLAIVVVSLPFVMQHTDLFVNAIKDPFVRASFNVEVPWNGLEGLGGLILIVGLLIAHVLFSKARYQRGLIMLLTSTTLFTSITLLLLVPRIERYTQGPAIDFFKEHANERAYCTTKHYDSYADRFYSRKQPHNDPNLASTEYLMKQPIDRPVYVVCKTEDEQAVSEVPGFRKIGSKGGYSFFVKDPGP